LEDLQLKAGIEMAPERTDSAETYTSHTTQKHVTAVSGIKTCKAALKDELKPEIQAQRVA
jgi:hypothetical protein